MSEINYQALREKAEKATKGSLNRPGFPGE
ncbi:TPA: hypothetical protein OF561_RS25020, partial [Escherichia coli]